MGAVYLMDPNRSFERKYNRNGWPFLMLVDETGKIVYQCNNLVDRDKTFMRHLQTIAKTPRKADIQTADRIPYLRSTLANNKESDAPRINERFTSLACGVDDTIYTTYTATENGNSNVYLRVQKGSEKPKIIPVAATDADEYDGTVITDAQGKAWVCWTSNERGRIYNIYLNSLDRITNQKPARAVSQSKEDVMHGRMAADASNNIWVTYYKWHKIKNISRDKEVYVRKFGESGISKEIQISPTDVSQYEDHTDSTIAIVNNQPVICWSWDFHQPKGYTKEAHSPTIFARALNQQGQLQKLFHLSDKSIDMTPVIDVFGDELWCAWDALGKSKKALCLRKLSTEKTSGSKIILADNLVNTCSPDFAFYKGQKGAIVWSQIENGKDWSLW